MARKVSTGKSAISLRIHDVKFTITDDKTLGRMTGTVEFQVKKWVDAYITHDFPVKFVLLSCWKFPHKNSVSKAHLFYNATNPAQRIFMENIRLLGEVEVGSGEVKGGTNSRFSLMADANIIRYGLASGIDTVRIPNPESGRYYNLYESKAQALASVINQVAVYRTVGGHKKINFSKIGDDVLTSVGFVRQPDLLQRGVPMWYGDPETATQGSDTWKSMDARRANSDALLQMIQDSVGSSNAA